MEVNLSPEIEKKLNEIAEQSGRPAAELAKDAIASYVDELADTRAIIDSRYDDVKSGKVKLIDGEDAFARLHERIEARRTGPA